MPKTHEKPKNQIPFGVKIFLLLGAVLLLSISLNVYFTLNPRRVEVGRAAGPGDCDGDGFVDLFDYGYLSRSFGLTQGQAGFDARCDFYHDANNIIDLFDFQILANNFGHTGSATNTPSPRPQNTPTPGGTLTHDQLKAKVLAWKSAHTGNGGKDWDINTKTNAQISADAALRELISVCGDYNKVRPVYPLIAWEYGGADHPWINPGASALVYCVYIPQLPSNVVNSHWWYNPNFANPDGTRGRVIGDLWVLYPDFNPCKNQVDKYQVLNCLGDYSNHEILVDTMSLDDGHRVSLELMSASTQVFLILANGNKVELLINQ